MQLLTAEPKTGGVTTVLQHLQPWKGQGLESRVTDKVLSVLCGCKATWKRECELPWREAGPPNHQDDKEDSDR